MNSLIKNTILSAAVAATTLAALPAEARDQWRDHRDRRVHGSAHNERFVAGLAGFAIGAIIVGAIAAQSDDEPVVSKNPYRHPRPRPDRDYGDLGELEGALADAGQSSLEPWSRAWFRYCEDRYRTFDGQTGTYVGYDGREHFCNAG